MHITNFLTPLFYLLKLTTAIPAGGPEPPVQARPPAGPVSHRNASCQMSLWQHSPGKGNSWTGWPLSYSSDPKDGFNYDIHLNNQCVNLIELGPGLSREISSYKVTGWCECEFFAELNCDHTLFSAYNRGDGSLWSRGRDEFQFDNRIQSYKCWYTQRPEDFRFCSVTWQGVAEDGLVADIETAEIKWKGGHRWQDVIQEEMLGDCRVIEGQEYEKMNGLVSSVIINGCTCNLYEKEGCLDNGLGSFGNSGSVTVKDDFSPLFIAKGIGAYRCFHPVGIPSKDRDDMDRAGYPILPPEAPLNN
ncbi:hypothetical protein TWF281_002030 [Arthrobotrys megalospora]